MRYSSSFFGTYKISLRDSITHELLYNSSGWIKMECEIPYTCAKYCRNTIDQERGIHALMNMSGAEAIPILEKAISNLKPGDHFSYGTDYDIIHTEGHARYCLECLLHNIYVVVTNCT